jgi:hypothetical protein
VAYSSPPTRARKTEPSAEEAFLRLQRDPLRYAEWAAQVRADWAARRAEAGK